MQQRAQQTRANILQAAVVQFSKYGLHGARIDRIAAAAGANKQRIYAYFGGKEKLFAAVLTHVFDAVTQAEQQFLELTSCDIERLAQVILYRYVAIHEDVPHFWRLLAWENLEGGRHVEVLRGVKNPVFGHLRRLYQEGQAQGLFPAAAGFESFMFVLMGLSFFFHSNRRSLTASLGLDLEAPAGRQRLLQECLQLLPPALAPRPAAAVVAR